MRLQPEEGLSVIVKSSRKFVGSYIWHSSVGAISSWSGLDSAVRLIYGSKFKNYVRSYLNFSSLSWVSLSWRARNLRPRQKTYRLIKIILVYRAAETFSEEEQLFALTGN